MTYGASVDEKDVPMMVAEDYYVASSSWIALKGPVKIELDEILWGRRPKGGATGRGGQGRRRASLKGREWSAKSKDGEFDGIVVEVCIGP
jgi:hypothetical protein